MNILKNDLFGVPSTMLAIFANVTTIAGLQLVNVGLTVVISILSIIFLIFKIKNEKAVNDKSKDGQG